LAHTFWHCGKANRAKTYRLASSKPVYRFQHLAHVKRCKGCGHEFMEWRGEYHDAEHYSTWFHAPASELAAWKRRIKAGEAKPEAQLTSEWSQRAARPADIALYYHNTIQTALRYCTP
jgi:hypothetical protein